MDPTIHREELGQSRMAKIADFTEPRTCQSYLHDAWYGDCTESELVIVTG
jgi:hypothetical protein